ncbi:hypothetical protein [Streptococcus danieliae]|uniref:hypothetical protein n=1 Tax=Streptococcus danieliae TaxID=747656 RepID=UPI0021C6745C|nr:hypothetical protein [Streptococcus danieliae]
MSMSDVKVGFREELLNLIKPADWIRLGLIIYESEEEAAYRETEFVSRVVFYRIQEMNYQEFQMILPYFFVVDGDEAEPLKVREADFRAFKANLKASFNL